MTIQEQAVFERQPAQAGKGAFTPSAASGVSRSALALYALWVAISGFGVASGQIELARQGAMVLLVGVAATNAMFLMIAHASILHRPPDKTLVLAQGVMAVTWATLFSFMSSGSAELAFGMYFSVVLFALHRLRRSALAQLAVFAIVSYASVTAVKLMLTEPPVALYPHLIGIVVFGAVVGWYLIAGQRPTHTAPRDESLQALRDAAIADQSGRDRERQILESLKREKGRTDRTNYPFSICAFDVDRLDELVSEHGADVTRHVLLRMEKRARGELRAMDGIDADSSRRQTDLFDVGTFVIVLPQTNLAGAARCAERIRSAAERFPIEGRYAVSVSAGVAEYRRGESVTDLLERAHSELAAAEAAGGNRVTGYSARNESRANVIPLRGGVR